MHANWKSVKFFIALIFILFIIITAILILVQKLQPAKPANSILSKKPKVVSTNVRLVLTAPESESVYHNREGGPLLRYTYLDVPHDQIAIVMASETDNKLYVQTNKFISKKYDQISNIVFDPKGQHVYYMAKNENNVYFVTDQKETSITIPDVNFKLFMSPDGKHFAIVGRVYNSSMNPSDIIELDGIRQKGVYQTSIRLQFSPDGSRLAFWEQKGNYMYLKDGEKEYGPFDISSDGPIFSPDSNHIAYAATNMCVDQECSSTNFGRSLYAQFSPDSSYLVYVAGYRGSTNGKLMISDTEIDHSINGISDTGNIFDGYLGPFYISPDSSYIKYAFRLANKFYIVTKHITFEKENTFFKIF